MKTSNARSKRGETLIETLAAILISVLSFCFLTTVAVSSAKIIAMSAASFDEYYDGNNLVSAFDDEASVGEGKLKLTEGSEVCYFTADHESIDVDYYANTAESGRHVVAFKRTED